MHKIRYLFILLWMMLCPMANADVQVSIGFNVPIYPNLVVVPGYPVYYAPELEANYFFYDGMYWVYQDDEWYQSTWYNGPWYYVEPEFVPVFVLRIPVSYYRQPPMFFFGWRSDAPPRWGDHWGRDWEQRRSGWDRWDRRAAPRPAPIPSYQRQYSGDRYPHEEREQRELNQQHYRYQPRDPKVRQQYREQQEGRAPSRESRQGSPANGDSIDHDGQRPINHQQERLESPPPGSSPEREQGRQQEQAPREDRHHDSSGQRQNVPVESKPQQEKPVSQRPPASLRGDTETQRPRPDYQQQNRPVTQDHERQPERQIQNPQNREQKPQGNDARRESRGGQEQQGNRGRNQ